MKNHFQHLHSPLCTLKGMIRIILPRFRRCSQLYHALWGTMYHTFWIHMPESIFSNTLQGAAVIRIRRRFSQYFRMNGEPEFPVIFLKTITGYFLIFISAACGLPWSVLRGAYCGVPVFLIRSSGLISFHFIMSFKCQIRNDPLGDWCLVSLWRDLMQSVRKAFLKHSLVFKV